MCTKQQLPSALVTRHFFIVKPLYDRVELWCHAHLSDVHFQCGVGHHDWRCVGQTVARKVVASIPAEHGIIM